MTRTGFGPWFGRRRVTPSDVIVAGALSSISESTRARNSRASRLLPMPGGPETLTATGAPPSVQRMNAANRVSSSLPRPTNGVASADVRRAATTSPATHAPETAPSATSTNSKAARASSTVVSSTSSSPLRASRARVEALSTTSPTGRARSTRARPVATPTRAPMPASCLPISTALAASPPRARRAPKNATMASLPRRTASAPSSRMRAIRSSRSMPRPTSRATMVVTSRLEFE